MRCEVCGAEDREVSFRRGFFACQKWHECGEIADSVVRYALKIGFAAEKAVESGALEQAVDDFRFLSEGEEGDRFEAARKDLQDIIDAVRGSDE